MRRWRRRASEGVSRALVAATAGAGLGWFLDPRGGRARRAELLDRVARGLRSVQERYGGPAGRQGESPARGAGEPQPPPPPGRLGHRAQLVARATASVFAARAVLGKSLLRFPVAIAGATLLGGSRREDERAGGSAGDERAHARRQREATRAREERGDRAAHVGGWHPEPEVVEVKSPAELEPGIAHASPEPTFENRVDRGTHDRGEAPRKRRRRTRAAGAGGEARRAAPDVGEGGPAGSADVTTDPAYLAPDVGAGVREGDLGSVAGPDAERGAGEAGDEGPARREPDDDGP